ncbi:MAG: MFS transporter [Alphaproteobacteria bacterium]|nr:MFS transporter [Alphaproteobacteria bacterium]
MTVRSDSSLQPYLVSLAAHFAAGGMMGVVFPWLIVHELHEDQAWVGIAQAVASLPMMILVLFGGAAADGRDLRAYLARLQLGAAIVVILLALVVASHLLTFFAVTACMFMVSIFSAFIMPARDSLLSHVAPPSLGLPRAVAMSIAATFGGQLLGTAVGASASTVGAVPLLCVQAILLTIAGILSSRLAVDNPDAMRPNEPAPLSRWLHVTGEAFVVVWQHERLRTIILYLVLGAPLFNGWFMVGIPLMVRDVYHGSSAGLSLVITTFLLGLTISSFLFSRLPPVERPGRLMMLLSLNNLFVFAVVHFELPFEFFAALMFWWGLTSGVAMAVTRGMIQVAAPHAYRARVLSMLQFANVAGGPPGSLMYGFLAQWVGILNAVLVVPISVAILWLGFRFFSSLWEFRRDDANAATTAPIALD